MRADRLLTLVLLLQSRGRMTASQIAEALEVSVATARRDLEALSTAGVPVYPQAGRHGGWQLLGDARTDLTGFTSRDARALFGMLGTAGLDDSGTRDATRKLLQALPRPLREEAETLATSIHHDHAEWGRPRSTATSELELLRAALLQNRALHVTYTSRSRGTYEAVLEPRGLVAKAGEWYLVADAGSGPRTYRVSRLERVALGEARAEPPDRFDLAGYWREHTAQVEERRSGVAATLRVPRRLLPLLQQQFGSYATVLGHDSADGIGAPDRNSSVAEEDRLLEVRAHLLVALAEQLAGWGGRIEVVAPEELRAELVRIGEELVARHRR